MYNTAGTPDQSKKGGRRRGGGVPQPSKLVPL